MTWNLYNSRKEGWKISLAERLKYYRNKSGLSQATVAKELKVSRQAISKWENGRGYPDIDNLILLSNTYKVSIDQLLKEIEEVQEEITNNKVEYTQKRQFLILNKKKTEVESNDEGLILLTIATNTVLLFPLGLLIIPFILIRNKKTNSLYKLVYFVSIFSFLINIFCLVDFIS